MYSKLLSKPLPKTAINQIAKFYKPGLDMTFYIMAYFVFLAFITPLGFCVGTFFGGLIVGGNKKLRENLHLSSRLIVGTLPITIICMIALSFLSCDMKDHTASILK